MATSVTPEAAPLRRAHPGASGFTLIELLVVVAIVALASAVVSLAVRDPSQSQLEREGTRLAALLESARVEARSSGLAVQWLPRPLSTERPAPGEPAADFTFVGLPASAGLPRHWLSAGITAQVVGATAVVLGPEPLIGAQRITLRLDDRRLTLSTDGLGPFVVAGDDAAPGTP